jgi:hypothetical protein
MSRHFPQHQWEYSLIQPKNALINKFSLYPTYVAALIKAETYVGYSENLFIRGATQKFPKFECRAKTACSTVVGL